MTTAERFERTDVWTTADGRDVPIADLSDGHLTNVLSMLSECADSFKDAAIEEIAFSRFGPSGDAAQDAYDSGLMLALAETPFHWLQRQPLYRALVAEAVRRGLQ